VYDHTGEVCRGGGCTGVLSVCGWIEREEGVRERGREGGVEVGGCVAVLGGEGRGLASVRIGVRVRCEGYVTMIVVRGNEGVSQRM